jgi:hypothetical protein
MGGTVLIPTITTSCPTRHWSQSAEKNAPPLAQFFVEPVEKVSGETYLIDTEKSDIVECATIKISSLGGVR